MLRRKLARGHGAALPVADLHRTVVVANRSEGHHDTAFGDAVEERLVQVRIFAHVLAEDQAGRIEVSRVSPSGACASSWWSVPYWGPAAAL